MMRVWLIKGFGSRLVDGEQTVQIAAGADWPDSRWAMAIGIWRTEGSWGEQMGPKPGQPGCRVPPHLLIQTTTAESAA